MIVGIIGESSFKQTLSKLKKFTCDDYILVKPKSQASEILASLANFRSIKTVQLLDIDDLILNRRQLLLLIKRIKQNNIGITIIDNKFPVNDDLYLDIIDHVLENDTKMHEKFRKEAGETARQNGNNIGRPQLPQSEINHIVTLRYRDTLTFREISEKMGVSIGTISKYCNIFRKLERNV